MVASTWHWDTAFMLFNFGWRCIAVLINATVVTFMLRNHIGDCDVGQTDSIRVPILARAIHILFLVGVVLFAHHPVVFIGLFLFFLGFTQAYERYQKPLILKDGLLVGIFLAGLVVLGASNNVGCNRLVPACSRPHCSSAPQD